MSLNDDFQAYVDKTFTISPDDKAPALTDEERQEFQTSARPLIIQLQTLSADQKIQFLKTEFSGTDYQEQKLTPLQCATKIGDSELLKAMLQGLSLAQKKDLFTTQLCGKKKDTLLHLAVFAGNLETIQVLLEATEKDPETFNFLMDQTRDFNVDDVTPTHYAASLGREEVLDFLLTRIAQYAPAGFQTVLLSKTKYYGNTLLHSAAHNNQNQLFPLILEHATRQNKAIDLLILKNNDEKTIVLQGLTELQPYFFELLPFIDSKMAQTLLNQAEGFARKKTLSNSPKNGVFAETEGFNIMRDCLKLKIQPETNASQRFFTSIDTLKKLRHVGDLGGFYEDSVVKAINQLLNVHGMSPLDERRGISLEELDTDSEEAPTLPVRRQDPPQPPQPSQLEPNTSKPPVQSNQSQPEARGAVDVNIQGVIDRIKAKRIDRRDGFLSILLNAFGKPTRLFKNKLTKAFLKTLSEAQAKTPNISKKEMDDFLKRFEYAEQYLEVHLHRKNREDKNAIFKKALQLLEAKVDACEMIEGRKELQALVNTMDRHSKASLGFYKEQARSLAVRSTYDENAQKVLQQKLDNDVPVGVAAQKYLNQTAPKPKK